MSQFDDLMAWWYANNPIVQRQADIADIAGHPQVAGSIRQQVSNQAHTVGQHKMQKAKKKEEKSKKGGVLGTVGSVLGGTLGGMTPLGPVAGAAIGSTLGGAGGQALGGGYLDLGNAALNYGLPTALPGMAGWVGEQAGQYIPEQAQKKLVKQGVVESPPLQTIPVQGMPNAVNYSQMSPAPPLVPGSQVQQPVYTAETGAQMGRQLGTQAGQQAADYMRYAQPGGYQAQLIGQLLGSMPSYGGGASDPFGIDAIPAYIPANVRQSLVGEALARGEAQRAERLLPLQEAKVMADLMGARASAMQGAQPKISVRKEFISKPGDGLYSRQVARNDLTGEILYTLGEPIPEMSDEERILFESQVRIMEKQEPGWSQLPENMEALFNDFMNRREAESQVALSQRKGEKLQDVQYNPQIEHATAYQKQLDETHAARGFLPALQALNKANETYLTEQARLKAQQEAQVKTPLDQRRFDESIQSAINKRGKDVVIAAGLADEIYTDPVTGEMLVKIVDPEVRQQAAKLFHDTVTQAYADYKAGGIMSPDAVELLKINPPIRFVGVEEAPAGYTVDANGNLIYGQGK